MSQLRADLWASAFVRRHNDLGNMCVVVRRGDPVAGQIWVELDHLDGTASLYAPAPTVLYEAESSADRLFEARLERASTQKVADRLAQEARFDPDFWHIAVEVRHEADAGLSFAGKTKPTNAATPFFK